MKDRDLINRFTELSYRAYKTGAAFYTDFLDVASQSDLLCLDLPVAPTLDGGYPEAERRIGCFGDDAPDIVCVRIEPVDMKFADRLTHRDFLGSVLALGINRAFVGDIVVYENRGYVFCKSTAADLILSELDRVRHTNVRCSYSSLPDGAVSEPVLCSAVAASLRLDAVISAVFDLSRSESKELFASEKVFVSGRVCTDPIKEPGEGDRISVRGHGKFIFREPVGTTGKGRIRFSYKLFK